jgi:uncharacterized membrane protein YjgN (DUF898 family)
MTTFDAPAPVAARTTPPFFIRIPGPIWFLGRDRDYWRLMLRGCALLAVTLGIYRFWLTTDQRRFLWSNTEVLGQSAEYTGTARELLIGFLIAIAILLPIYGLIFAATLDLGIIGKLAGVIGFVLLSLLGQFAVYRARRYRLTRTIYRGVRFHQTGSAWLFAIYGSLWWLVIILTLGLAYPWAQAALERYKMRHTYLGNLQGRFEGTGGRLFQEGFVIWLVTVGPFILALIIFATQLDTNLIEEIITNITDEDELERIFRDNTRVVALLGISLTALAWPLMMGPLLYPMFQATVMRWWASGLRFGDVAAQSNLRVGQVYGAYLSLIGWSSFLSIVASVVGSLVIVAIIGVGTAAKLFEGTGNAEVAGIVGAAVAIVLYVAMALLYSAIYHVKLKLAVWRMVAQSIDLSNPATLDTISSVGAPASSVGEGLADALSVGSF